MDESDITDLGCACCGKGGDGLKTCTACKLVRYCNVECQKAHRPHHKKACKKRAAELFDEALFKLPPPKDDCSICFLPLPCAEQTIYQPCCGQLLCRGCSCKMATDVSKTEIPYCPFCREPAPTTDEEMLRRCRKRMKLGDAGAWCHIGLLYIDGRAGLPRDRRLALELLQRASELGSSVADFNISSIYVQGYVEMDKKKVIHHYQRAAMGGHERARHNLGCREVDDGNIHRALKHWMIAARSGHWGSMDNVRKGYDRGYIKKVKYENTLLAYQKYHDDIKSKERDIAVVTKENIFLK
mmetsp:Transcript_25831/g.44120  ORF Transcript_25831/g.44120 Transcript_25831/m.44120 type:complete len:298 (-) Transcript_25831:140-1033(-)